MSLLYEWLLAAVNGRAGKETANANALVYRDTYISWRGLVHRVDRRAQDLKSMGIGEGTWVGVMLGNVPDFVILTLALSKLRAVCVPLDPTTGSRDLDMILEAAPLKALITRPHGGDVLSAPGGSLRVDERTSLPRFVPESRRRLQGTLLSCNVYKRDTTPEDLNAAVVLFTLDGGGDPKGVVRTDEHLRGIAVTLGDTLGLSAADRTLCIAPLFHSYGFDFGLLTFLSQGSTLFLDDETVVPRLAKLLAEHQVDVFPATPAIFAAMARVPTARPLKIPRARFVSSGSALSGPVAQAFRDRLGVPILSCYHTTETGPVTIDRDGASSGTVGKPCQALQLRIAAANGTPLPTATTGPVWVKASGVSATFLPRVELRTRGTDVPVGRGARDGWLRTGDLGYLDREGRLTLTGREDDLVKVDGRRVALGEVEGCLESFAQVRAAQARIEFDEYGGPRVVARVVRQGRCKPEEIIDHCARNLAPYKVPRAIEFCDEI